MRLREDDDRGQRVAPASETSFVASGARVYWNQEEIRMGPRLRDAEAGTI